MAAVARSCNSPRQRESINYTTIIGYLPEASSQTTHRSFMHSNQQKFLSAQNLNSSLQATSTIMYPSLPKYHKSTAVAHHHHQATPNQQHSNSYNAQANTLNHHQINSTLAYGMPVSSGYSSQHSTLQKSYGSATVQRTNSAVASSDICRNYWGHSHATSSVAALYRNERHSKRKSAVELLAETKALFVKTSDSLMDRTNLGASTLVFSGKRNRTTPASSVILDEGKYNPSYGETTYTAAEAERRYGTVATAHSRRSSQIHHHRHSHGSAGGMYQGKFRLSSIKNDAPLERETLRRYRAESYNTEPILLNETKSVSFEEDVAVRIPPPLYFSQDNYDNIYDSGDEPLVLTENYRPISPPAEYAEDHNAVYNDAKPRYNYQRSYSHSHEIENNKSKYTAATYNINSHKSLPDLHTQINRHSPHSEILSCCSRGNRSIKSTGESSLNRDSGGSSGHYTHRSEPCYRQHRIGSAESERDRENSAHTVNRKCCGTSFRRDSGSSTQHSNNSFCDYSCKSYMDNMHYDSPDYLLNFTTPEVPEAFQDDYVPPSPRLQQYHGEESRYYNVNSTHMNSRQTRSAAAALVNGVYMRHKSSSDEPTAQSQSPNSAPSIEDISPPPIQFKRQKCIRFKNHNRISLPQSAINSSANNINDAPPPATHSSCHDSYRRSDPSPRYFFPKCFSADEYLQPKSQTYQKHRQQEHQQQKHQQQQQQHLHRQQKEVREKYADSNTLRHSQELHHSNEPIEPYMDLEKFFDRLGLNDDKFHEIYTFNRIRLGGGGGGNNERDSDSESSTVFFSDVSTVDSMRLPDSTETQPQTTQIYRPTEPPSIVERNARIIKWLCNIRKAQSDTK